MNKYEIENVKILKKYEKNDKLINHKNFLSYLNKHSKLMIDIWILKNMLQLG